MQTSPSSMDTSKRRPRGDMYLRAEQRHQAEAAAARLTEILTPGVSSVYEPEQAATAPIASEALEATPTVARDAADAAAVPAATTVAAPLPTSVTDVPLAPVAAAVACEAANAAILPEGRPVAEGTAGSPALLEAPVIPPVAAPGRPDAAVARDARPLVPRHGVRNRTLQSLVPASAFAVVAIAALVGIVETLRPAPAVDAAVQQRASATAAPTGAAAAAPAVTPATAAVTPATAAVTPAARAVTPAARAVTPAAAAVTPAARAVTPAARAITPAAGAVTPAARAVTPAAGAISPAAAALTPATVATAARPPAVTPVHTASEGQLRITSTPAGARVTVNGIGWGQTPVTLTHLSLGDKTVRVTQDGYASQERVVNLRGDNASAAVHLSLRRAQ